MGKDEIINLLKELATKYGYNLVKKQEPNILPEMPVTDKKYSNMDSNMLSLELTQVEQDMTRLNLLDEKIKEEATEFMGLQGKTRYNQTIFDNNKIDPRKIQVSNKKLLLLCNLKAHLDYLLKQSIERELTGKFLVMHPDFKNIVKSLSVQRREWGDALVVEVVEDVDDKVLKDIETKKENEKKETDKVPKGVTSMKSLAR